MKHAWFRLRRWQARRWLARQELRRKLIAAGYGEWWRG